ncbi:MAG: type II secretion system F family protein [Methanomicrobiales archaeon]
MNRYERLCFRLAGSRISASAGRCGEIRSRLLAARIQVPWEVYLSTAAVTALVIGIAAGAISGFLLFFLGIDWLIVGVVAISGLLIAALITGALFWMYPAIVAGDRRRQIDASLPHAITYITAMSAAGIPPASIFRSLGASDIYGESAGEAALITREIEIFGRDVINAMRVVSSVTPSDRMREFLQGAMASIASGGNLTRYFRQKADQYAIENRQQQHAFLETLALIAESYVTAVVAGSLFLIILQSIMSVLGGDQLPIFLLVVIYLFIPGASVIFVILISSMTPEV